MDAKALIELFGRKPVSYAQDVPLFLLSPRQYLNKVLDERSMDLATRLVFYFCAFAIIEVSVFSALGVSRGLTGESFLGIVIYEVAMSLVMVPWLFVVALASRCRFPLKSAIAYLLTFKPVCMVFPIIAYGLFLMTEDYVFAIVRGALTLAYVIALVVVFPAILGRSIRHRATLVALSATLVAVIFLGSARIRDFVPPSAVDLMKYTVIYDPIGVEYDSVSERLRDLESPGSIAQQVALAYDAIVEAHRGDEHNLRSARALFRDLDTWRTKSARCDSIYAAELDSLANQRPRLRFATSRGLADMRVSELRAGRNMLSAYGAYLAAPDSLTARAASQSRIAHIQALVARVESEGGFRRMRYYLRRALMLYDH